MELLKFFGSKIDHDLDLDLEIIKNLTLKIIAVCLRNDGISSQFLRYDNIQKNLNFIIDLILE